MYNKLQAPFSVTSIILRPTRQSASHTSRIAMSEPDSTHVQPIIDGRGNVRCADYFPSCDFVAANGHVYIEHVQDIHRLRDLHENDQTYLCCPFKPCTVKTIAWSCLRGHMERHLGIHPLSVEKPATAQEHPVDTAGGRHADADGSGHHWTSMDHTANAVTPIYNQQSDYDSDLTHSVYAVSDFGYNATSALAGDAGSSASFA